MTPPAATPTPSLGDAGALPDRIALLLRDRILSGELRPGTFLRVDRIGEELGVSQTPVREALQSLRADDLVRALPRRGYVVAPLARDDVVDLFDVQAHLTGELAARAARALDDARLTGLRERDAEVSRLVAACDAADGSGSELTSALAAAEHEFHVEVHRCAGARKLAWLSGCAAHYLPPHFYTSSTAWRAATLRSHVALLDALAAHDADTARAAMERHVLDGRDLLLAHLDALDLWA